MRVIGIDAGVDQRDVDSRSAEPLGDDLIRLEQRCALLRQWTHDAVDVDVQNLRMASVSVS